MRHKHVNSFWIFCSTIQGDCFNVATFNIQTFGQSKMKHPIVRAFLLKIAYLADVMAIQELRDRQKKTIPLLLDYLNKSPRQFAGVTGPREGRGSMKEQYVLLYDKRKFSHDASHVFPDANQLYHRPPLAVRLTYSSGKKITLISFHVDPDDADREIGNIPLVLDWSQKIMGAENIFLLGDFNADCTYYDEKKLFSVDKRLSWIVRNNMDTTVGSRSCTYDRIAVFNLLSFQVEDVYTFKFIDRKYFQSIDAEDFSRFPEWKKSISAASFIYKTADKKHVLKPQKISDHFPVFSKVCEKP